MWMSSLCECDGIAVVGRRARAVRWLRKAAMACLECLRKRYPETAQVGAQRRKIAKAVSAQDFNKRCRNEVKLNW